MRRLLLVALAVTGGWSLLALAQSNRQNVGQIQAGVDSTGQGYAIYADDAGTLRVQLANGADGGATSAIVPVLNGTVQTTEVWCQATPTPIPDAGSLAGRASLLLTNTGAEVWVAECPVDGVGMGTPLSGGSLSAPGGTYQADLGPGATQLCCVGASAQTVVDAGPAICGPTADGGCLGGGVIAQEIAR